MSHQFLNLSVGLCLVIGFGTKAQASMTCAELLSSETAVQPIGLLKKYAISLENQLQQLKIDVDAKLSLLRDEKTEWTALDPVLIQKLEAAQKLYQHTNFDVMTPQRTEAIKIIATELNAHPEFKNHAGQSLTGIVQLIADGGRNLNFNTFGPEHILNHARAELGIVKSPKFMNLIISIQSLGTKSRQLSYKHYEVSSLANRDEFKSLTASQAIFKKIEAEVAIRKAAPQVPADITIEWARLAQKYQASNMGGFQVLTPGHHEAMSGFRKLLENPFFKDMTDHERDTLGFNWNRVRNTEDVSVLWGQIRVTDSRQASILQSNLNDAQKALDFIGEFIRAQSSK